MKVKEKKLADGNLQLKAVATAAEVDAAFDASAVALAQQMGMRPDPNKTVSEALRERLDVKDIDSILRAQAADYLVPFAIDARNIFPINAPKPESITPLARGKAYSFQITVIPRPSYELASYEPVKITVPKFTFDESLVDAQISQMLHSYPEFVTADPHPVGNGDTCFIALQASVEGKRIDNLCTEGRTLSLGQGFMPPEFEEQVCGMDVGETKSFAFEGPNMDDFEGPAQTYECTVTILEIQQEKYPELTDEWVQQVMPMYKDVEGLKKMVRTGLEGEARHQYDLQVMGAAQAKLAERFEGSIPNEAYETTAQMITQSLRAQLAAQGKDFREFVEEQGGEQQFNMGLMMQARQTLRCDYALDALFAHENLQLTDEDIREACRELNPQNPFGVQQEMESSGRGFALREVAQRYAASKYLVQNAVITNE